MFILEWASVSLILSCGHISEYRMAGFEIPEPSDHSSSEDDDITYLTDLYQPEHQLPESVRVINKLLNSVFDRAWEVISEQDRSRQGMKKIPVVNPTEEIKVCVTILALGCHIIGAYI